MSSKNRKGKIVDGGNYTIQKLPLRPDLDRHTCVVIYELLAKDILQDEIFSIIYGRQLNKNTWDDEAKKAGPGGSNVIAGHVGVPVANILIELKRALVPEA